MTDSLFQRLHFWDTLYITHFATHTYFIPHLSSIFLLSPDEEILLKMHITRERGRGQEPFSSRHHRLMQMRVAQAFPNRKRLCAHTLRFSSLPFLSHSPPPFSSFFLLHLFDVPRRRSGRIIKVLVSFVNDIFDFKRYDLVTNSLNEHSIDQQETPTFRTSED